MLSYQYRDLYYKDNNNLIFITGIPILGKTVFMLKQDPASKNILCLISTMKAS